MSRTEPEPEPSVDEKLLAHEAQRGRRTRKLWWLPMWVPVAAIGGTLVIAAAVYALVHADLGM